MNVSQKKYSPAMQKYMKNTETLPHDAVTHYNLANTLQLSGRGDEAQSEWAQAINAKPPRHLASQIAYNQGLQYIQKGEYDKAQSALIKSLKLWSPDVDAKKNLEMALLELNQKKQQKTSAPNKSSTSGEGKQKSSQSQSGQGQFSKEQSEQILDSMINNKMLRPNQKQKRDSDEQDW